MRRQVVKLSKQACITSSFSPLNTFSPTRCTTAVTNNNIFLSCTPRSFRATPALYALIRSTSLKKEDPFTTAQNDAKKGKLNSEKVAGLMHSPNLKPELAVKIFDLAVKHKVANSVVCDSVLDYLKDKKTPEHVSHIWKTINEKSIPLSITMLEVVYDLYAEAGDTDKMYEIIEKLNTLKPANPRFYNGIIELFMMRNQKEKAFAMIEKIKEHGAKPDSLSYGLILKVLDPVKDFELIVDTYKKMRGDGVRPSGVTVFFMIEAYGRNGFYDKAIEMFDIGKGMGLRMTVNPYISVIRYLGKAGHVKRAYDTFELILTDRIARGPVCFHTMIEVFAANNFLNDAFLLLQKMLKEGYKPNLSTFQLLLDPLLASDDVGAVSQIVEAMKSSKVRPDEPLLAKFSDFEARTKTGPYWSKP